MTCSTSCDRCMRTFLNSRTLEKHRLTKHGVSRRQKEIFYHPNGHEVDLPRRSKLRAGGHYQAYKEWLGAVTERINGAHHPKFPGGWFRIEINQTPDRYFHHILWKMEVPLHSAKMTRHLRQPFLSAETMKYTYKMFEVEPLVALLKEQKGTELKLRSAFMNEMEIDTQDTQVPVDPRIALELAKSRANSVMRTTPTSRSAIIINEGEGRATREFELQWWPQLYHSNFGKLCLRFFVNKVSI